MSNSNKRSADYKVQIIVADERKWPYLGNGYRNKDHSITLLLDSRWKLVHEDGTTFAATEGEDGKRQAVKVMVRVPFKQRAAG